METNLEKIKETAKVFLYLDIQEAEGIPPEICIYHPFASSSLVFYPDDDLFVKNDILHDLKARKKFFSFMEKKIDEANLVQLFILMRKPYHLTFIKNIEPYLSPKDLAELLAHAWVSTENPNQDANCTISYLIKMFKRCDKKYLMTPEDYETYESLPDEFRVYRGVAVGRNPVGLSWTQNLDTAKWFAHRFDKKDKQGYIETGMASKEHVLAYFNTRNEDEIVYNSKKLDISILKEV